MNDESMGASTGSSQEPGIQSESKEVALKIEVVVLPVSDVDRAREFYLALGWTQDVDLRIADDYRIVEFTPPGSPTSVIFGTGVTDAQPGSGRGHQLVTRDIDEARQALIAGGATVSEIFHDETGVFRHAGTAARIPGHAPNRQSYGSWVSFEDPDGNSWLVQEVTERIPGRIVQPRYDSVAELAAALRAAAIAHGVHEAHLGHEDAAWPEWYAEYMVRSAAGQELPD